jgi:hypothetical protein
LGRAFTRPEAAYLAALTTGHVRARLRPWLRAGQGAGAALLRQAQPVPEVQGDPARLSSVSPEAAMTAALTAQVSERARRLRSAIETLQAAPALRAALSRDLAGTERRIRAIEAGFGADATRAEPEAAKIRARLMRVSGDLDRQQEIIDGAVAGVARGPRPLPRDADEAYAALGVNPNVNERTLKKLIDALRVSWHPDLATSDEDRALRDEKIREINVAWDLIAARRVES